MSEIVKIKSIVIDTFTAFQKNEILNKWENEEKLGKTTFDDWKDYGVDIVMFNERLSRLGFTLVGILGYEGTGKSFGMKHLEKDTNIWYNVDNKPATWIGGKEQYGTKTNPTRYQVIPTSYNQVLNHINDVKSKGLFVNNPTAFLIGHIEDFKSAKGEQRQRLKTFGKVANKMNVEDKLTMCYYTEVKAGFEKPEYTLRISNSGFDTCRTNEGMHEGSIPNNFQLILDAIEKF